MVAFPTGAVEADPVLAAEVRAWLGGERGPTTRRRTG